MAVVAALPLSEKLEIAQTHNITFVVPASDCNLNCPACFIKARKEVSAEETCLTPSDYRQLVTGAANRYEHLRIAIQGYEPLLPESWEYTYAILDEAKRLGLSSSLVTNGTYLGDRVEELESLAVDAVTVSIDSSDSTYHDITRGTLGAHSTTTSSLDKALALTALSRKIVVASMLQPNRHHYLDGMALWLAQRGVKNWVVGPVLSPRTMGTIENMNAIFFALHRLQREAIAAGVHLVLDDEFSLLENEMAEKVVSLHKISIRRLKRLERTIRFSPSGTASVGSEILAEAHGKLPRWTPAHESAGAFLERVLP